MANLEDGVVKFRTRMKNRMSPNSEILKELNFWRDIFYAKGLIGRDPEKYGGFGYGNMSQRSSNYYFPVNKREFVITGSQTGHIPHLNPENYAIVYEYYPEENFIIEGGVARASSESLTHGAIYNLDNSIRAVVHCHSPETWERCIKLGVPTTDASVEAGTPEMAKEVYSLLKKTNLEKLKIFATSGHKDGIFAFGKDVEEAALAILEFC